MLQRGQKPRIRLLTAHSTQLPLEKRSSLTLKLHSVTWTLVPALTHSPVHTSHSPTSLSPSPSHTCLTPSLPTHLQPSSRLKSILSTLAPPPAPAPTPTPAQPCPYPPALTFTRFHLQQTPPALLALSTTFDSNPQYLCASSDTY